MRITAFQAWVRSTVTRGYSGVRRAGMAIARKIREASGQIEAAEGIGDDEQGYRGRGNRVWAEVVEEIKKKVEAFLGRSTFERMPRLSALVRRFLGISDKPAPLVAPAQQQKKRLPPSTRTPTTLTASEVEANKARIRAAMIEANSRERGHVTHGSVPPTPTARKSSKS